MAHQGEIFSNRSFATRWLRDPRDPRECMPYNENAHLMTAMFRQQLINCETFLHASPSEICLRPTVRQCVCCKRAANERKEHIREASREEREGEIDERDILLLRHTSRESLCELSRWKAEIYGSALCTSGVCTCKRPSQARVLASTYLHTSGPRKHLLKPTSFQTSRVYFHTDSLPARSRRVTRSNDDSLVRVIVQFALYFAWVSK